MESVGLGNLPPATWTTGRSRVAVSVGETSAPPAEPLAAEVILDAPQLPPGFTLRVKPDRRREQLPIPAGFDRRRPRE
jgi:hypothetical protein